MREKCGPISGIRKEPRIEESQRQDMFEAETVTLAVPVNERDHITLLFRCRITLNPQTSFPVDFPSLLPR